MRGRGRCGGVHGFCNLSDTSEINGINAILQWRQVSSCLGNRGKTGYCKGVGTGENRLDEFDWVGPGRKKDAIRMAGGG